MSLYGLVMSRGAASGPLRLGMAGLAPLVIKKFTSYIVIKKPLYKGKSR